jgi:hypothetical protein
MSFAPIGIGLGRDLGTMDVVTKREFTMRRGPSCAMPARMRPRALCARQDSTSDRQSELARVGIIMPVRNINETDPFFSR